MSAVTLVVGGSVAPELVPPVLELLEAAGAEVDWRRVDLPESAFAGPGDPLEAAIAAIRETGLALKTKLLGAEGSDRATGLAGVRGNPNVQLRQRLGLFAGVRPIRPLRGLPTRYPELDLILVRENTEDIYKGIEHVIVPGVVQSLKVVTRAACERIARFTFDLVERLDRKAVTFIHKGNIMKQSDGLFMRTVKEVAARHPNITYREMIVDAACMQLVLDPEQFDVLLMGNLYGDILSNLGTGLAGGISGAFGVNVGDDCRVYEAIHGEARHLEGSGRANPLPVISPAMELLRHLGQSQVADRLLAAVENVLTDGETVTPDLGGSATAVEMCGAIAAALD